MTHYHRQRTQFDVTNQYEVLKAFPDHARKGLEIGTTLDISSLDRARIRNIVLAGMGGSAIAGDIIRQIAIGRSPVPVVVNRSYHLPAFVGTDSLVVVISYSGNTEETLASYTDAIACGAQVIVVTSGGQVQAMSQSHRHPCLMIPGGFAPRASLGFLFFSLAIVIERLGFIPDQNWNEIVHALANYVVELSNEQGNEAISIAEQLLGYIPILYASHDSLDVVAVRWRCQIEENAKVLAYSNVFPEMNHNEIVGWQQYPSLLKQFAVVLLREPDDDPRIARRMDIVADMIRPIAAAVIDVTPPEGNPLGRLLSLICLGDWVSYYLAIGSGIDPFPIEKINLLKAALERS